jgi:predicted Zn-dependent protease
MLVEALVDLKRYAEAASHLRRLTQLAPADPAAWFHLGKTYEELAGRAFRDLVDRDPESAYGLALVAEARLKQERRDAAFHLYRRAIERDPSLRGLRAAVASIYRSTGPPDWAAVERRRERRPPRPDCPREA